MARVRSPPTSWTSGVPSDSRLMVQRSDVWRVLGGFDETLPNNFNDVDPLHAHARSGT